MVDFEITRKTKLLEVNNDMAHNYYYLIQGKIYNNEKNKYRRFKYVEFFDIFDLQEYFEKDIITAKDIKEYLEQIENSYLSNIKNFNDKKHLKKFYEYCNETINNYNSIVK